METFCLCMILIVGGISDSPPPIETLPLLVTVYDTALCNEGEACLQGNGDGFFASMTAVSPDWYGKMAACPKSLYGRNLAVTGLPHTLWCGDNFGYWEGEPVETVTRLENGTWVARVDVFWPVAASGYPPWNYYLFYDWEVVDE